MSDYAPSPRRSAPRTPRSGTARDPEHRPFSRSRGEPRHAPPVPRRRGRSRAVLSVVAVLCMALSAAGWAVVHGMDGGLLRSLAHSDRHSTNGDRNILIMGLDSRLDAHGHPLPDEVYRALHAGDATEGGLNANVLMVVHLPAGGGRATAISIPRDDSVRLRDCPDDRCEGKIKQAYGLAADQERRRLSAQGVSGDELESRARDAGRTVEMETVSDFLGGVPVDHFVEVTLGAFYELAKAVEPIPLCIAERTIDSYSGADFQPGIHPMDAAQAVAYVRQRRDTGTDVDLTDMDRGRRQQAFISAVLNQLATSGTLTDPVRIGRILTVARKDVVVDDRLDLTSLATEAPALAGGGVTFYTLPIDRFGRNDAGEDVNLVDLETIRRTTWQLLHPGQPVPATARVAPSDVPSTTTATPSGTDAAPAGGPFVPVPATAEPGPTQLSALDSGASPCVK